MADPDQLTVLSLCSGGAGLDLGFKLAVPGAVTVGWVEWEAFAGAELVRRMEAGELDAAPVWTDLRSFDGRRWAGCVDFILAGYPCQPFSTAGRRDGADDPRHLWPHVRRAVEEVQPWGVFFENVSGHFTLGLREVAEDLERMGYKVAVTSATAAEVGASHKRERVFILGLADAGSQAGRGDGPGRGQQQPKGRKGKGGRSARLADSRSSRRPENAGGSLGDEATNGRAGRGRGVRKAGRDVVNPTGDGRGEGRPEHGIRGGRDAAPDAGGGDERPAVGLADGGSERPQGKQPAGPEAGAVGRGERALDEASGDDRGIHEGWRPEGGRATDASRPDGISARLEARGDVGEGLAHLRRVRGDDVSRHDGPVPGVRGDSLGNRHLPIFPPGPGDRDLWRDILAARPHLAPASVVADLRGVADGLAADRSRYLRLLGNGVVPLQAAYAFVWLWMALEDAGRAPGAV